MRGGTQSARRKKRLFASMLLRASARFSAPTTTSRPQPRFSARRPRRAPVHTRHAADAPDRTPAFSHSATTHQPSSRRLRRWSLLCKAGSGSENAGRCGWQGRAGVLLRASPSARLRFRRNDASCSAAAAPRRLRSRDCDLDREIAILARHRACYLPPTTHLSSTESTAAHRAPFSPKRRHLRSQHAHSERSAAAYLQISRDCDLARSRTIWARRHARTQARCPYRSPPLTAARCRSPHTHLRQREHRLVPCYRPLPAAAACRLPLVSPPAIRRLLRCAPPRGRCRHRRSLPCARRRPSLPLPVYRFDGRVDMPSARVIVARCVSAGPGHPSILLHAERP